MDLGSKKVVALIGLFIVLGIWGAIYGSRILLGTVSGPEVDRRVRETVLAYCETTEEVRESEAQRIERTARAVDLVADAFQTLLSGATEAEKAAAPKDELRQFERIERDTIALDRLARAVRDQPLPPRCAEILRRLSTE